MKKIIIMLSLVISIIVLSGCESLDRAVKDHKASVNGLNRTLKVFDQNGNQLKEYSGKFDIEVNDYGNKVKFDLDGKRIIIFNAIVITEEN